MRRGIYWSIPGIVILQLIGIASTWRVYYLATIHRAETNSEIIRLEEHQTKSDITILNLQDKTEKMYLMSMDIRRQQIVNMTNIQINHDIVANIARNAATHPIEIPETIKDTGKDFEDDAAKGKR